MLEIRGALGGEGGSTGVGIYCESAYRCEIMIYWACSKTWRTYRVRLRLDVANLIRFSFERSPCESGRTAAMIESRYKYVLSVYWTHFCKSAIVPMMDRPDYLPRLYHDLLTYP